MSELAEGRSPTSSPGKTPRSKWRIGETLAKAAKVAPKYMSLFRLNSVLRLQKTNKAASHWKQPPEKPFHRVSRDKILHDSWSI